MTTVDDLERIGAHFDAAPRAAADLSDHAPADAVDEPDMRASAAGELDAVIDALADGARDFIRDKPLAAIGIAAALAYVLGRLRA